MSARSLLALAALLAAGASSGLSQGIQQQVGRMGQEVQTVRDALADASKRSERVLGVSERLMEKM